MPLFTTDPTAQASSAAANAIRQTTSDCFNNMLVTLTNGQNAVWNNPNLTPAQICAALGTDAGAVFTGASLLQTLLNTLCPNCNTFVSPQTVTVNDDGTVTIGS